MFKLFDILQAPNSFRLPVKPLEKDHEPFPLTGSFTCDFCRFRERSPLNCTTFGFFRTYKLFSDAPVAQRANGKKSAFEQDEVTKLTGIWDLKIGGVSIEPCVEVREVQGWLVSGFPRCANSLAAGRKWIIENQCMGLCEPNATLTTSTRGEWRCFSPSRCFIDIDALNTPVFSLRFQSGASTTFAPPFPLVHTAGDDSER
jgi:hypothetical protein